MNNDVVGVDQHPVRGRKPFDPNMLAKSLLDLVAKLNRHGSDLPRRAAGRDHHMVGDVRLAGERDGHDFHGLIVVERLQNELVEIVDVCGRTAGLAGAVFNGMFGQGVSWQTTDRRGGSDVKRANRVDDASGDQLRE